MNTHIDELEGGNSMNKINQNYNLIKSFFKITKIPMVLTTSFNENEPIVYEAKEALDTFLRKKWTFWY